MEEEAEMVRLTVEVTKEEYAKLEHIAEVRDVLKTVALRQAIRDEAVLREHVERGDQVLIKEGNRLKELQLRD
ncbi:MAG: hypothetical protein M1483_03750 [Actinobacteria bacterium]|jgi:predicted transcriptional regulator|nr:hypothetical protein [Actinomycetota bacterium]MCL6104738.1 hypothetical protein [Actinomycetota bacterium]